MKIISKHSKTYTKINIKNIILIIVILSILPGCSNQLDKSISNKNNPNNIKNDINIQNKVEEKEPEYIDDNPIKVGIYENNKLVKSYQTNLANHKDIGSFYAYYTNDETLISSKDKTNWNHYYNMYESIDKYKTGFHISFEVGGKLIEETILDPTSQFAMSPYLYIYLYDDINQPDNTWYSHLEPNDVNESTIYSSIKLYLAEEGIKITSPITFTAFTYDEDDFDESGKYRGISSYTIEIKTYIV